MTLRVKTVEFRFTTDNTSRTSTTRTDLTAITVYIPEVTSRTFLSVMVEVSALHNGDVAAPALTSFTVGCKLGAVAFEDATRAPSCPSDSTCRHWCFLRDFTSYFTTNFGSGASQTCQVGFAVTGATRAFTSARLIITFQYDDASQTTRVKTVKIPFDSTVLTSSAAGGSLVELGTNQVPLLDTFLPEASKVYRQIAFEITFNDSLGISSGTTFLMALDSEGTVSNTLWAHASGPGSHFVTLQWVRNDLVTSAVHAFKLCTSASPGVRWPTVVLVVTYEYNHSTSTRIMNSLEMAVDSDNSMWLDGTGSTDRSRKQLTFSTPEPGTLTLVQSGVRVRSYCDNNTGNDIIVSCGSQSERTYVGMLNYGGSAWDFIVRVDAAAPNGAGFTLASGENTFTINLRRVVSLGYPSSVDATLFLNYTSDKASGGADTHSHTVQKAVASSGADGSILIDLRLAATLSIAETNYRINNVALDVIANPYPDAISPKVFFFQVEILTGEGIGEGWLDLGAVHFITPYAYTTGLRSVSISKVYQRWLNDPGPGRLDAKTSRKIRMTARQANTVAYAIVQKYTYHALAFTFSGAVTGYTGDGSGITVTIHRNDTGEQIISGTTAVGGTYSLAAPDNTVPAYAEARQDGTHLGRSDIMYAS